MPEVFISYAHEDRSQSEQLYRDLRAEGYDVWIDSQSLIAGTDWPSEVRRAIQTSQYFIAVLSCKSVSKRGHVQKEMREAIELLDEFPESETFIIPIRLEPCDIGFERLKNIHRVDMFPNWNDGVARIVQALRRRNLDSEEWNIAQNSGQRVRLKGDTIRLPHRPSNPVSPVATSRGSIYKMAQKIAEGDVQGFFGVMQEGHGSIIPAGTLVEVLEHDVYEKRRIVKIRCLEGELRNRTLWTVSQCVQ